MYSKEIKLQAARLTSEGLSRAAIAETLQISQRCLDHWRAQEPFWRTVQELGQVQFLELRKQRGRKPGSKPLETAAAEAPLNEPFVERAQRRQGRRRFRDFVGRGWSTADPLHGFLRNWHVDLLADHLQAVAEGGIKRLLITMPPRVGKSLECSVLWPAWVWLERPGWRGVFVAGTPELAERDQRHFRNVLTAEWYRTTYGPAWKLIENPEAGYKLENDSGGLRLSLSVGEFQKDVRADCLMVDDPPDAKRTGGDAERYGRNWWFEGSREQMLKEDGSIVVVMHRTGEDDLAEHALGKFGYQHLNLPMEYVPDRRSITSVGQDPRKHTGELLFPALHSEEAVAAAKKSLGSRTYSAHYQQAPLLPESAYFPQHGWRFWQPPGTALQELRLRGPEGGVQGARIEVLPASMGAYLMAWHCELKDALTPGQVDAQVWGRDGAKHYLLDHVHEQLDLPATMAAILKLRRKWPSARIKAIDCATYTHRLFGRFAKEFPEWPIYGHSPQRNLSRATDVRTLVQAELLYLPHPVYEPWIKEFIEQCAQFPNGVRHEYVETMTAALSP